MHYKVELLTDSIIYVERSEHQTERSLQAIYQHASKLSAQLRRRGKPVLVLANHTQDTHVSERVLAFLLHFDFDRIAVYGTPKRLNSIRDLMYRANGLEGKVASFQTREEALEWLYAMNYSTRNVT